MFKDELYRITSLVHDENTIEAVVEIRRDHAIFKGHFPGQPVLPGACILQMVKEIVENPLGKKLRLKIATNLKFLQIIDPEVNKELQLTLQYRYQQDELLLTGNMRSVSGTCFKMQGTYAVL